MTKYPLMFPLSPPSSDEASVPITLTVLPESLGLHFLEFLTWYTVHRWQIWGACRRGVIIWAGHGFDGIVIEWCRAGHGKFGHPGHHDGQRVLGEGWLRRHCVRAARGKISRESRRSRLADCGRRWTSLEGEKEGEIIYFFHCFFFFFLKSHPLLLGDLKNLKTLLLQGTIWLIQPMPVKSNQKNKPVGQDLVNICYPGFCTSPGTLRSLYKSTKTPPGMSEIPTVHFPRTEDTHTCHV